MVLEMEQSAQCGGGGAIFLIGRIQHAGHSLHDINKYGSFTVTVYPTIHPWSLEL